MSTNEVYHCRIYFTGRVQGVGFRYTTYQVAKEFEVSGQVRNLADGRVELEAEGARAQVTGFVDAVRERLDVFIRKVERTEGTRAPRHAGFRIA